MIEYQDKLYELKFNLKRVELIEAAMGKSIMAACVAADKNGLMQLRDLKAFYAYGLKETGAPVFVAPGAAREICEGLIEEIGYIPTVRLVQAALMRDLPFFFRTA